MRFSPECRHQDLGEQADEPFCAHALPDAPLSVTLPVHQVSQAALAAVRDLLERYQVLILIRTSDKRRTSFYDLLAITCP